MFLLLFLVTINIKASAGVGEFYTYNDSITSADTLAVADTLSVDSTDSIASAYALVVADTLSLVKSFFAARLDSIVAKYDTLKIDALGGDESTNPVFVKMFTRPTLYKSVLGERYYKDVTFDDIATSSRLGDDAKRSRVIDGVLLDLYKNSPSRVWATEDELRKEISADDIEKQQMSGIMLNTIEPIVIPDNLEVILYHLKHK